MNAHPDIRPSTFGDDPALSHLCVAAFQDEDLLPLLADLLCQETGVLSLVAERDGAVIGHIALTRCGLAPADTSIVLLGPLAVLPSHQRMGIGSALVAEGLSRIARDGSTRVFVLGDPVYYGRFGFAPETVVQPPYPLVPEWAGAWRSLALVPDQPSIAGRLSVPSPWRQPRLWAPSGQSLEKWACGRRRGIRNS